MANSSLKTYQDKEKGTAFHKALDGTKLSFQKLTHTDAAKSLVKVKMQTLEFFCVCIANIPHNFTDQAWFFLIGPFFGLLPIQRRGKAFNEKGF